MAEGQPLSDKDIAGALQHHAEIRQKYPAGHKVREYSAFTALDRITEKLLHPSKPKRKPRP